MKTTYEHGAFWTRVTRKGWFHESSRTTITTMPIRRVREDRTK